MGTEFVPHRVEEDDMEAISIPPGFESLVPFTLRKKIEDNQISSCSRPVSTSEAKNVRIKTEEGSCDNPKTIKSLKRKPRMSYRQSISSSGDGEIESKEDMCLGSLLPKGVIRGCEECENCQRVVAKWHPEEAHRPNLEDAPVFYPSTEEFEDTLKYISSIRSKAEAYGICRIVPPPSWNPPCPLKEKHVRQTSKFASRIQRIDKLQNRDSMRKLLQANQEKKKKRRCYKSRFDDRSGNNETGEDGLSEAEDFGFEPGPDFTLDAFQKYADDFKAQYFRKNDNSSNSGGGNEHVFEEQWQPSVVDIEGEYWRMVEKPTEAIEVLYGADVETGAFGSGFPKTSQQVASDSDIKYINSGWNLNNFPRLPGSVLSYESSDISGVLVPWLYVGMCFSSFCWHVEDHHLYSLNYMHWGSPKLWYGVPGSDAPQLEASMRKHLPDLFEEQPDLLHKLVTQLSPSILKSEGVPVYRCVQNPGEFVLTFPRAYHAGFNCGFNCAEAVNVAPVDWLPHGHNAVELYCQQGRQTSISHDKLLLGASREAVKANWEYNLLRKSDPNNLRWKEVCGMDGILSTALKTRIEIERVRRDFLCKSSQALKMESSFDANSERECCVCLFDLHLSAAGCHKCSPAKYACLNHAKQLCSCSWSSKFFLFRYDIDELKILVEALEGKLSSVYRWARFDLGLSLSSYVSKDKSQIPLKEISSPPKVDASKEVTKYNGSTHSSQNVQSLVSQDNCLKIASSDTSVGKQPLFPENKDVIVLSDDEEDNPSKEHFGTSQKLTRITQKRVCPDDTSNIKAEEPGKVERLIGPGQLSSSCSKSSLIDPDSKLRNKDTREHVDSGSKPKLIDDEKEKPISGYIIKKSEDVDLRSADSIPTVSSPSEPNMNNVDRSNLKKGPRMARILRRINRNVEPLEFGAVCAGKLWCDSRAIYPKGFKSRVKYIDVINPASTCFYVSEILDAGRDGPLFMVSVEHSPNEVFIHESAGRCWEMVWERVNHEIIIQRKIANKILPPLQPPKSLDGMEMFGFTSPTIIQAIQDLDKNRVCTEYWDSRPLLRIPRTEFVDSGANLKLMSEPERILDALFKKANQEELQTLYSFIKGSNDEQSLLIGLLQDEINKHIR